MDNNVDFRSELFKPFLSEDAQVNPECYGAELSWWLSKQLALKGVETSYPNYEDWGWFLEYIVDGNEYWLCCSNVMGESNLWRLNLTPRSKGILRKSKPLIDNASPLLVALSEILSESANIWDVRWGLDDS